MLTVLLALLTTGAAHGAEEWTYWKPRLNLYAVSANGQRWAQVSGGVQVGYGRVVEEDLRLVWDSRAAVTGLYGVQSKSLGVDARIGSFIGPRTERFRYRLGPDLFYNVYGSPSSPDYHLPGSLGVGIVNQATLIIVEQASIIGLFTPSWLVNPDRQADDLGPFHEIHAAMALALEIDVIRLNVGYQWSWNAAGRQQGLILSGGI